MGPALTPLNKEVNYIFHQFLILISMSHSKSSFTPHYLFYPLFQTTKNSLYFCFSEVMLIVLCTNFWCISLHVVLHFPFDFTKITDFIWTLTTPFTVQHTTDLILHSELSTNKNEILDESKLFETNWPAFGPYTCFWDDFSYIGMSLCFIFPLSPKKGHCSWILKKLFSYLLLTVAYEK